MNAKSAADKPAENNATPSQVQEQGQPEEKLLKLRSVMVINDANTLHAGLLKFVESNSDIVIDASSVEMIDTAILQLLLGFVEQIKSNNRVIKWKEPSAEFCNRASILGLSNEFGIEGASN